MHERERPLRFPNLLNARDLGGYPTLDGGRDALALAAARG